MGFKELIGNEKIKRILQSYIINDGIPYSIIFYGPDNSNPTEFAMSFSKALNCTESRGDFCDRCSNCIEISKGIYPDVKIIYPEGQFYKKDQIMYLIEDNRKRPLKSDKKVYIVSEASRMNENSSNAFLKVLEEPSPSTVFILLTNNLNLLLPTIKSRCQVLRFSYPSKKDLGRYYSELGYDDEKIELLSSLSQFGFRGGSDENYYNFLENRMEKFQILEKLIKKTNVQDVLLSLFSLSKTRSKFIKYFEELVNLLSIYLRDIIVLKTGCKDDLVINVDLLKKLGELKEYITVENALSLIAKMELIIRDIRRNLNSKILIQEFINSYI